MKYDKSLLRELMVIKIFINLAVLDQEASNNLFYYHAKYVDLLLEKLFTRLDICETIVFCRFDLLVIVAFF